MRRILALDLGTRRTGAALADEKSGTVFALETIRHKSTDELLLTVKKIVEEKKVTELAIGLPLLPGGDEGSQSTFSREVANHLSTQLNLPVKLFDERYSSMGTTKETADAKAACSIADLALGKA